MLMRYTHLRAEDLVGRLGHTSTTTTQQYDRQKPTKVVPLMSNGNQPYLGVTGVYLPVSLNFVGHWMCDNWRGCAENWRKVPQASNQVVGSSNLSRRANFLSVIAIS